MCLLPIATIGKQNRIRLVHGFTENEGIVEVQQEETHSNGNAEVGVAWGTVCVPSPPSKNIGDVVCQQLGYDVFGGFRPVDQFTSLGHRRVALKVKSCEGSEQTLESCDTESFPSQQSCSDQQNLAVLCASECKNV